MRISTPVLSRITPLCRGHGASRPGQRGKYLEESRQYQESLRKAVDRAITLAPVMKVRGGTYRSYIPPVFYIRGPSIGQVVQLPMTDDDWSLEMVASVGIPAADDVRLDGISTWWKTCCRSLIRICSAAIVFSTSPKNVGKEGSRPRKIGSGAVLVAIGYSYLANVYLRRDEIPSFLRQWVNNYAAYAMLLRTTIISNNS